MKLRNALIASLALISLASVYSITFADDPAITINYLSLSVIKNNLNKPGYSNLPDKPPYHFITCPAGSTTIAAAKVNSLTLKNKTISNDSDTTFTFDNTNLNPNGKQPYYLDTANALGFKNALYSIVSGISSVTCPSYKSGVVTGTETINTTLPVITCSFSTFTATMNHRSKHPYSGKMTCTYGTGNNACTAGEVILVDGNSPPEFACNFA